MRKIAFLDKDGTLNKEPKGSEQVDSIEQLEILPGVIENLQRLKRLGYQLVIVTNQDGLGTASYLQENFDKVQERFLELFKKEGIEFYRIFICPHFPKDNCLCRKPKISPEIDAFLKEEPVDYGASIMIGDRESDRQFAQNIKIHFCKMETNGSFPDVI